MQHLAGSIYIGECAPHEIRGTIMTFWQVFYSVGSFIAYSINYAWYHVSFRLV